jgi:putative PIN family toxin of toxin-antitoxin system
VKAVLDTSVLVSAFLKPESLPGAAVRAGLEGHYGLCLSLDILAEAARTLRNKTRLCRKYSYVDNDVSFYIDRLVSASDVVTSLPNTGLVSRDPDDDHVIAAAVASGARAIVTGDKDLLCLKRYLHIDMLSVREFLTIIEK